MQPILTVDLTQGEVGTLEVPPAWQHAFLGGASLAARLLYDHLSPEVTPLDPGAPLLFLTGPLTGTLGPAVGRFVVAGRSPATGLWAESNCGGFWGPELRRAGFDGLWITGRATSPCYLWVHDGQVQLRSAEHLWGLETYAAQAALKAEPDLQRARAAVIGPAAEAGIPFAVILCDHGRVAGRTGLGAVMGSKNLKAIAVQGKQPIPLADPEAFAGLRRRTNRSLRKDSFSVVMREMGSSGGADYFDYLGLMPKRYFQRGEFPGASRVTGATLTEELLSGVSTCHGCVIACGRVVRLGDGVDRKGPEYETMVGFGPNLWIDDLEAITRLGELCDRYGMDTISMSNTLGLAFQLYEQGLLPAQDLGGLALAWGDSQVVETLIHQTARRTGFGAYLADGARALGARYGVEDLALHVNGLEMAYHDPRGASGMALVYATSPIGASHNQSDYFLVDIGQAEESLGIHFVSRQAGVEKAAQVARHQDWRTVCNALVLCYFANVSPNTTLGLVHAAIGWEGSLEELVLAGERSWNLKRGINNRLGLTRSQDRLPRPLLSPLQDGGSAGFVPDLEGMLTAYYQARGWDPETGYPRPEKLSQLGLEWLIEDLWPGK